jgi:hypothetical protein
LSGGTPSPKPGGGPGGDDAEGAPLCPLPAIVNLHLRLRASVSESADMRWGWLLFCCCSDVHARLAAGPVHKFYFFRFFWVFSSFLFFPFYFHINALCFVWLYVYQLYYILYDINKSMYTGFPFFWIFYGHWKLGQTQV